jgi:hypothetical protein
MVHQIRPPVPKDAKVHSSVVQSQGIGARRFSSKHTPEKVHKEDHLAGNFNCF